MSVINVREQWHYEGLGIGMAEQITLQVYPENSQ